MPLLQLIEAHPVTVGLLAAALSFLFPYVRTLAMRPFKAFARVLRIPNLLLAEFTEFKGEMKAEIALIKKQLMPNGGTSVADALRRVEASQTRLERGQIRQDAHHKQHFIVQPRPAMELDGSGNALMVSAAMGRLLRTDPADLRGFSYLQYLDADRVEDFREAFVRVASNEIPSTFGGFTAKIYAPTADGGARECRGTWEFRASPVGPRFGGDVLYTASLHPVDEDARAIADKNRWVN